MILWLPKLGSVPPFLHSVTSLKMKCIFTVIIIITIIIIQEIDNVMHDLIIKVLLKNSKSLLYLL
jgi:hypothetical protein